MNSAHYSTDICYQLESPSVYVKWNKNIKVPFNQLPVRPRLTPLLRKLHKIETCHRNVIPVECISNKRKCVSIQFVPHPSTTQPDPADRSRNQNVHHHLRVMLDGKSELAESKARINVFHMHAPTFDLFSNDLLSASTQQLHLETRTVRMVPNEWTLVREPLTRDANGPIGRTTCWRAREGEGVLIDHQWMIFI